MQIKLTGEQPFQVLSTTFTIGPSTSGYDLYFSADGVNYTQLFTVGANVNRQVTQVAAGSYYKLVGNTGNVVVNWYGNCVVDSGGGGGQYVLPVASQSTLGGVKIGSGITIDSGGTIYVEGGGAEVKTIVLSTTDPTLFTQEDISALTEMVEYLADFPVTGLPMARINCEGEIFSLAQAVQNEEGGVLVRDKYVFINAYNDMLEKEGGEDNEAGFGAIDVLYVNAQDVTETVFRWWASDFDNNYYVLEGEPAYAPLASEGKMAYVKEHVKSELEGTKIYIDDFGAFTENTEDRAEGYLARVHWGDWEEGVDGEDDLVAFPIYQSGNQFFWDFENDGKMHELDRERDGEYYKIRYRTFSGDDGNGSEAYIEIYPIDETPYGDYIISYSNYVTGETIVYEEIEPGNKYTFRKVGEDEVWVKQQDSHYLYIGDGDNPEASEEDRIAFYNAVMANIGDNWYMDIIRDGEAGRYYYEHTLDSKPVFCYDAGNGVRRGYALNADGSIEYYHEDRPDIPGPVYIEIDSAGTMSTERLGELTSEQYYRIWLRYIEDSQYGEGRQDTSNAPLKYAYRQYEEINDEVKLVYYIGGEIYIGGTLYKGAWHLIEWEWGDTPIAADTWTTV